MSAHGGAQVILVHRLQGEPLFVNADLIETVESAPDTIVTLIDGRKVLVAESPQDVVACIQRYRAAILVAADDLRAGEPRSAAPTPLSVVPRQDV
jgi:flagellar protein FlbD